MFDKVLNTLLGISALICISCNRSSAFEIKRKATTILSNIWRSWRDRGSYLLIWSFVKKRILVLRLHISDTAIYLWSDEVLDECYKVMLLLSHPNLVTKQVTRKCSTKTIFLKVLRNLEENTWARVYFQKSFIEKEPPIQLLRHDKGILQTTSDYQLLTTNSPK